MNITRVEHNTYYAELEIAGALGTVQVDARPSDSIAVALRLGTPIFAAEDLLSEFESDDEMAIGGRPSAREQELSAEQLKAYLERLRPEDFGKFNP